MGAFDDLIPAENAGGAFDDLIPAQPAPFTAKDMANNYGFSEPAPPIGGAEGVLRGLGQVLASTRQKLQNIAALPAIPIQEIANLITGEKNFEVFDSATKGVERSKRLAQEFAIQPGETMTGAGEVGQIAGSLAGMLPEMLAGGGGKEVATRGIPVLERAARTYFSALPSATNLATSQTVNRSNQLQAGGVPEDVANEASMASLPINAAAFALPIAAAGKVIPRMIQGAGANIATGIPAIMEENKVLAEAGENEHVIDPLDPKVLGMQGGIGALLAAVLGARAPRPYARPSPSLDIPEIVPRAPRETPTTQLPGTIVVDSKGRAIKLDETGRPEDMGLIAGFLENELARKARDEVNARRAFDLARSQAETKQEAQDVGARNLADVRGSGTATPEGTAATTPEAFTFFDAKIRGGQMTDGERVEIVQEGITIKDAKGKDVQATVVRFPDREGSPEMPVPANMLTTLSRPANPRFAQDIAETSYTPKKGVGTGPDQPAPRTAAQRITTEPAPDVILADRAVEQPAPRQGQDVTDLSFARLTRGENERTDNGIADAGVGVSRFSDQGDNGGRSPADSVLRPTDGVRDTEAGGGGDLPAQPAAGAEQGVPVKRQAKQPSADINSAKELLNIIQKGGEQKRLEAERKDAAEATAAEQRAQADREVEDFTLTGSDRVADANPNQGDLLQQNVAQKSGVERRLTTDERRTRYAAMSPDELRAELEKKDRRIFTSHLTGLPNKAAYEDADKLPVQAFADIDGLKAINDTLGHDVGDVLIKALANALKKETDHAFHISGDEFYVQGKTTADVEAVMSAALKTLSEQGFEYTTPDGTIITKKGMGFSYGTANNIKSAEERLYANKQARKELGLRTERTDIAAMATEPAAGREAKGGEEVAPAEARPQVGTGSTMYGGFGPVDKVAETIAKIVGVDAKSREAWHDWSVNLAHGLPQILQQVRKKPDTGQNAAVRVVRSLWHDMHTNLGIAIDKVGGSKTASYVRDQFGFDVGKGEAVGPTVQEAVDRHLKSSMKPFKPTVERIQNIIDAQWRAGGKSQPKNEISNKVWSQIRAQVMNRGSRQGEMGRAANEIAALLKSEHEYQRAAGVELGDQGAEYFPHSLDARKISGSEAAFIADASKAFQTEARMSKEDADAAAARWLDRELHGGRMTLTGGSGAAKPSHVKERVFKAGGQGEKIMAKWYEADGTDTLLRYILNSGKRAEIATRFGDNFSRWADYTDAKGKPQKGLETLMREEGAGSIIEDIKNYVMEGAGIAPRDTSSYIAKAASVVRTSFTLGALEGSALVNLLESVSPFVTTNGNLRAGLETISLTSQAVLRGLKILPETERFQALKDFAEDHAIISGVMMQRLNMDRFHGMMTASNWEKKILEGFFEKNLMNGLTESQRITDVGVGQVYIRRLAKAVLGKTLVATPNESARVLRDFGVPKGKEKEFAAWVDKQGDTLPSLGAKDPMAKLYASAIGRFVDTTSLKGDAVTRPGYANTTYGAMVYQLTNYTNLFHKYILRRIGQQMKAAANPKETLNLVERAILAAGPLPGLFLMGAAGATLYELKDKVMEELTGKKSNLSEEAKLERSANAANLMGRYSRPFEAIAAQRYGGGGIAAGLIAPGIVAQSGKTVDAAWRAATENEDSNSGERAFMKLFYKSVLEPMFQAAMSMTPFSLVTSAAVILGPTAMQEPFVEATAGKESERAKKLREREKPGVLEVILDKNKSAGSAGTSR